MAITRDKFLDMAERCFVSKKQYMMMVRMALDSGIIDLEKCRPDFSAVYPLATAIYEKETKWYIDSSSDGSWQRKARHQANELICMFYHPCHYIENFFKKYKKWNG